MFDRSGLLPTEETELSFSARSFLIFSCPRFLRHDNSFWGTTIIYWKGSQDGTSIWPKRFYPFTAIIFKSGGTRLYHALFSPISLSANLPRFKPNLTGQSNNPPFTDSCLRFEISWHVWVTFLVGYPTRTFTVTCSHVFMGSATYNQRNVDPPLLPIDRSVY